MQTTVFTGFGLVSVVQEGEWCSSMQILVYTAHHTYCSYSCRNERKAQYEEKVREGLEECSAQRKNNLMEGEKENVHWWVAGGKSMLKNSNAFAVWGSAVPICFPVIWTIWACGSNSLWPCLLLWCWQGSTPHSSLQLAKSPREAGEGGVELLNRSASARYSTA